MSWSYLGKCVKHNCRDVAKGSKWHLSIDALGKGNLIFCCAGSQENFWVGTSKNKNIDHGAKETCAIMSTQVTYENDHISLLQDSTISSALNFSFMYFIVL